MASCFASNIGQQILSVNETAVQNFGSAYYSACNSVVYTKTIIHLGVVESDGYLPPLR